MNTSGWICPKCEGVMSPTIPTCVNCKPKISRTDLFLSQIDIRKADLNAPYQCQHIWDDLLLMSLPPKKICKRCGTTQLITVECGIEL